VEVRTGIVYKLVSAVAAFLTWGGWAWCVNAGDGEGSRLLTAFAQGVSSFVITLVIVALVTRLYHYFQHPMARLWMSAIVTVTLTATLLVVVHLLVGTEQLLFTILPPSAVAFLFCLLTTFKLHRFDLSRSSS
jgi:hypothetical protein